MDKKEAVKATRNGAIAALISATFTVAIVLIAIASDSGGKLALWNDPWNFLDVILILGCAYGMYRKSRTAALLIFFYFIVSKIFIFMETQSFRGIGMALIFLYFYGKAAQGAFVYHKLEKAENPDYQAATKWTYILGVPFVLVATVLIAFAMMSITGITPSTRVQSAGEIKSDDIATLVNHGIVSSGDKVEYFYSQGLSSVLESGNILTDDRVILYFTDENAELQIYEIFVNEITDVSMETQGDSFSDSVYKISTENPERWLKLFLSVEQKGDRKFVEALQRKVSEL